jgi:cytochrome b561
MPYSLLQIALHWLVAALVLGQWLTYDAIARTHNPLLHAAPADLLEHKWHNYAGILIGFLIGVRVLLRLFFRRRPPFRALRGAERLAFLAHWSLYGLLMLQALTGFTASYIHMGAAPIHRALWSLVWPVIGLHVAAALYHLLRGDGVFGRMLPVMRR